jgi:peptide deformylase
MQQEKEKLVQYSELKPAGEIDSPEKISTAVLLNWWKEAKHICLSQKFTAIAFNQMSRPTLSRLGFKEENPSIIYIGKVSNTKGVISEQLLINPEIQIIDVLGNSLSVEGCGSITDSDGVIPRMFIVRPTVIRGAAYFWKPEDKTALYKEFSTALTAGSVIQHEVKHLEGKTALSNPNQIIDFTDRHIIKELMGKNFRIDKDVILGLLTKFDRWLIFDNLSDQFRLVGSNGGFIRNEFQLSNNK